jgi:NAD(P)-dependent dehydrogenase (short-subunit alcohol dehydrogenase family)
VTGPLAGRVAVVTGGSSGIGAAVVRLLRDLGAATAALDLHPTDDPADVRCDVGDPASVHAGLDRVRGWHGEVDILVHSAGVPLRAVIAETRDEDWDRVLRTNLTGGFTALRAVLPGMVQRGWGRIVTVSSGTAVRVNPGSAAYAASKAGLIALTKVAAMEGAAHGVTANVVAPGLTDTPMTRSAIGSDDELLATARSSGISNPMGVVLSPADIASAIAWFCLPEAVHVTGQVLHVSAGSVMP